MWCMHNYIPLAYAYKSITFGENDNFNYSASHGDKKKACNTSVSYFALFH